MKKIDKKIYTIFIFFIFFIFSLFIYSFYILQIDLEVNSRNFLFDKPVSFIHKNNLILDGYYTKIQFEYTDYCKLKGEYSLQEFEHVAYRYPNLGNVTKFYSLAKEKNQLIDEADQLFEAYKVISNSNLKNLKLKVCN